MDKANNFTIKVENEVSESEDEDEAYEEYIVEYADCKEEESTEDNTTSTQEQQVNGDQTEIASTNREQANAEKADSLQNGDKTAKAAHKLHVYTRNLLVNHFLANGFSEKSYGDAIVKTSKEKLGAYEGTIKTIMKDSQQYVYQECESLCFSNISDWLEVFKERKVPENCHYEPSLILNAIVNTEQHPDPKTLGGVDLKAVYSFLSSGLMGAPQKTMDPVSAKFLAMEFESLIRDANSDFADSQTMAMKEKLECLLPQKEGELPPSLDPLWLLEGTMLHNDVLKK